MAAIGFGSVFQRAIACGLVALAPLAGLAAMERGDDPSLALMPDIPVASDYRPEFSEGTARIRPLTTAQRAQAPTLNCTSYCGTTVSYTSWRGNTYVMQQFDGVYTQVLVPQAWFDEPVFDENARRIFINGFDMVYQYLYEIVGRRPGTTLDTIAYVDPPGCGSGCGTVGGLGVELGNDSSIVPIALDGLEHYGAIHELTHNFDAYGGSYKFSALPDSSHYWTTMLRAIYTFSGNQNSLYYHDYERTLQAYLDLPAGTASWQACVIEGQSACGDAAGYSTPVALFFRIEHLYGQAAVGRWIDFIENHASSPTDQDKLDHFFEAYSAAANRNVNCAFDELDWPISSAVRTWVDANIGTVQQNPDCTIGANGTSAILDMVAEFAPPATPPANDYTGEGGGFWSPQMVGFPGTAHSNGNADERAFTFQWSAGQDVLVYYCSPAGGHSGATEVAEIRGGHATYWNGPSFVPGTCNTTTMTVPPSDTVLSLNVLGGSDQGAYSIVAVPAQSSLLARDWGRLSVSRNSTTGVFTMTVDQVDRNKVTPPSTTFGGPQAVRFWVQGAGWVAQVPWSNASSFTATWTPPAGETGNGLVFNAQVLAATSPVNEGYASALANTVIYRPDLIFANGFEP